MDSARLQRHPAAIAAQSALRAQQMTVFGLQERGEDVALVALRNDSSMTAIVCEKLAGVWRTPTMVMGRRHPQGTRPHTTDPAAPLQELSTDLQEQLKHAGGSAQSTPRLGWRIISGLAAADGAELLLHTDLEDTSVPVGDDGFVIAFCASGWQAPYRAEVRTSDHHDHPL